MSRTVGTRGQVISFNRNAYSGPTGTIPVTEIFASIQGEGSFMGVPAIFIRTAGCPVGCDFCDSKNSWDVTHSTRMSFEEIATTLYRLSNQGRITKVVVTGGEPTIYESLYGFVRWLRQEGYYVMLETSGVSSIPSGYYQWVVCSPKPSTGYHVPKDHIDELKLVVGSHVEDIYKTISAALLDKYAGRIWLQPCDEGSPASQAENLRRCYRLAMKDPRFRVGIQLHKILEVR